MTTRHSRLAVLTGAGAAAALACTGIALGAGPAFADTPAPSATAPSTPAPSATAQACDKAPWEAKVQGAPQHFGAGSRSGDYLWHTSHGFSLRVTHAGGHDRRIYRGEIVSSAPMRLDPVRLEHLDTVALSANRKVLTFAFANHGYIDGVNFHTDCARTLTVRTLRVDSHSLPTSRVFLGYHELHPAHLPTSVHRYAGPSGSGSSPAPAPTTPAPTTPAPTTPAPTSSAPVATT